MRILISEKQSELIVNKSKFIGYSVIANSREDFLDRVREIKINNPSASHAVYGLRIKKNTIEPHFSDDGEPSGTGGRPLISILESKKIINGGLEVVRYYGGINRNGRSREPTVRQVQRQFWPQGWIILLS